MAKTHTSKVIQHLRRAVLLRDGAELTDEQLLQDYLSRHEEAALATLVRRHGPMVWSVCRRILRNWHDAEDAFQATFLVLVRKAASIASPELLANWLYGVAYQTALKARATSAKRALRERQVTEMPQPAVAEPDLWHDLQPLLDQELSRLPDKYRVAIVLCDLEGKTRKEAARQLGVPEGTLAARLARARVKLAQRLARHGLAVSGSALAAVLSPSAVSACVPTSVVSSTIKAATLFAAGQPATGVVGAKVAALTEGVLKSMLLTKTSMTIAVSVILGALGLAVGAIALPEVHRPANPPGPAAAQPQEQVPPAGPKAEDFETSCALGNDDVLKRVPPLFRPSRLAYYRRQDPDQARLIPTGPSAMYFRWADGKLAMLGMTFSGPIGRNDGGTELLTLLTFLVGASPQEIEGDPKLLKRPITGDFIVREGASREKVTSRLEEILRRECGLQLKLTFRQVERKVTVAHGRYRFTALPGRAADQAENQIELYGKQLYGDGSPGGGGDFRQFLKGTGLFLGHRVVGEVEGAPTAGMTWRYHRRSPATEEQTKEDTDPNGVLKHVSEQTGLTFMEETRRVPVLFVQRAEEPAGQPKR